MGSGDAVEAMGSGRGASTNDPSASRTMTIGVLWRGGPSKVREAKSHWKIDMVLLLDDDQRAILSLPAHSSRLCLNRFHGM
jgi:hypothetical protein